MKIDKVIEVIRESKRCPIGYKWDKKRKECVPKKSSKWRVYAGWGRYRDEKDDDESKKNGKNGHGSNGNGDNNGGSGNGNGSGSNGGNGNGGGNGGGGE
tara:strand:- start:535 stop:831 length:297 start_codon:yes stop_codon:yes gene_type:complete